MTDTTKPDDCKPERPCKGEFGDRETARKIWEEYGKVIDTEACCISWEVEVAAWAEPWQCPVPPCVDAFGDDYERVMERFGNWVTDECCIDPTDGETLPTPLRQYTCPEPEPTETPTEVPTEEPTEEPTEPPTIIVTPLPPEVVIVERPVAVQPVPAFTG